MGFKKLHDKTFADQPIQGGSSDLAKFKKRALAGQQFFDNEELALYIAETTAGVSDATVSKFGLPPLAALTNTGAVYMDGVNQYATSAFDPSTIGTGDLSVEIWFKPHHLETANDYFLFMLGDTTNGLAVRKIGSATNYRLNFWKNGSGSNALLTATPSELEWHQLVLTRSGTDIVIKVDNVEVYNATSTSYDMDLNSGCSIGSHTTPGSYWKGHVDLFRVWDTALPSSEIQAIYNSGIPVEVTSIAKDYASAANLKVDNLFEEKTGTTVSDGSGNSNTLTLVNSPTWHQDVANFVLPDYASSHALQMDGVTDFAIPFTDLKESINDGDFTLYVRASFDDVTATGYTFVSGEIAGSDNYMAIRNVSSTANGLMRGSGGATQSIASSTISNNTFYDMVLTRKVNASDGTIEFFLDGVSQGTLTNAYLDDHIDRDVLIGNWFSGSLPFGGKLRCIGIWDEVLTDNEIAEITTLGDHDFRTDSGNYASATNLLHFLVSINLTGTMIDLKGTGSAVLQNGPSYVSYP